jgi:hypothetical protein
MSLYPQGHMPFQPHGWSSDQHTADVIRRASEDTDLNGCLESALSHLYLARLSLEWFRAYLFRSEYLIDTQPLSADKKWFPRLPHDVPVLIESLKAVLQACEEWMESESCRRILETFPGQS